jgi:lipopolysaccharide export system permease protein
MISLIDIIDLNNKTRLKENILFNDIFLLTIENIPLRADELLFYAILFGAVIYFLELRKTKEFLILRINGISFWKTFIIVSIVPLMFGFLSIFILNPITSFSQKIYSVHHKNVFGKGSYSIAISNQGLWLRDRSNLGEMIIKGTYLDSINATIKKPVFFLINSDTKLTKRIDADWAYLENHNWNLENVKTNGESFNTSKKLIIKSVLTKDDLKYTSNNQYSLNVFEIPKFIKILESTGIPSIEYRVYFHRIFSYPIAFIGIVILTGALIFRNNSRLPPVKTISFTIIGSFLYFFLQRLFIALGVSEQMPIIVATWIPSIILLVLGLLVISLVEEN